MKTILITGASGGIGSAIAKEFAAPSRSLFLHYHRSQKQAERLAAECEKKGAYVSLVRADLAADDGDEQLVKQIDRVRFDVIIHNAGTPLYGLFTEMTNEQLTTIMNIHLLNPMKITRALLPKMIEQKRGKIIVISSIWGLTGASCEVAYSAAKGGLNSFVKALAKEVAPSNIQVNAIAPGAIETAMHRDEFTLEEEIPAHCLGTPEDVAHAVAFLASEKANYINGQVLSVNGAWYC